MNFIYNTFNEHSHYYAAFFAIEEAERTQDKTPGQPFKKLKTRRVSSVKSEQVMASLEAEGHDFLGLREEMRAAETRFQKKEGKCHSFRLAMRPTLARHKILWKLLFNQKDPNNFSFDILSLSMDYSS